MSIRLSLKCIEKILTFYQEQRQFGERLYEEITALPLLLELMVLFDKHRPEELNEQCVNLQQFDECFRMLRLFSDKMIDQDEGGTEQFVQVFGEETSRIFVNYVSKYLRAKRETTN